LAGGLALVGAGLASLTLVGPSTAYPHICFALLLVGAGLGLAYTVANEVILASIAPGQSGAAAAVSETAYELGMALGIATLGSIVAAVYRGLTIPPGIHGGVIEQAKQTLGGANQVAATLPADQADQLLTAARAAFTDGLVVAAGFGSALLLASVGVVWVLLAPTPQAGRVSPCSKLNTLSGS
jgi:DHA2 family multidrug resistance protein-like MFS transporter